MIDSAVCAKRVESQAKVWVVGLMGELKRQLQRLYVYLLIQLGERSRHEQHMAILDWAHIDEY